MNNPTREQQDEAIKEYRILMRTFLNSADELSRFTSELVKTQPKLLAAIWPEIQSRYNTLVTSQKLFAEKGVVAARRLLVVLPFIMAWVKNDSLSCFGDPYSDDELKELVKQKGEEWPIDLLKD